MSPRENNVHDDDFVACIQHAFELQTLPEAPTDLFDLTDSSDSAEVATKPAPIPLHGGRIGQLMATASILVVSVLVAVAFSRLNVESGPSENQEVTETVAQIPVEQQNTDDSRPPVEPADEDGQDDHAAADETKVQSIVAELPPSDEGVPAGDVSDKSSPIGMIELINQCVGQRRNQPEALSDAFQPLFPNSSKQALVAAFQTLGVPQGISSVRKGVAGNLAWLRSEKDHAFTYQANAALLSDLDRLTKGLFGDEILSDVLDGIRDDPNGPQIDLRKDVFPQFGNTFVLVANEQSPASPDAILIAVLVKDGNRFHPLLRQMLSKQPNSREETYGQTKLFVFDRAQRERAGICVLGNHLVCGSYQAVCDAVDRFTH